MTEFQKNVAQAAVAAAPAPQSSQTENVIEQLQKIEAAKVETILTELVKRRVLGCENTIPEEDATFGSQTFGSQPFSGMPPSPPIFFKFTKGPNWED